MAAFLIKRGLSGTAVLLTVITLTFFALRFIPGGPFDSEKEFPPAVKANIEAKYHLDAPLYAQFGYYLADLTRGDFGPSFKYRGRSVNQILAESFPISLELGFWAILIALLTGIPAGVIAAVWRNRPPDWAAMVSATTGISMPAFVLGALLILIFSHQLALLPPALWEGASNRVLPAITLGLAPAAYIARLIRSGLIDTLQSEFIRTAKAKGLTDTRVIIFHGLRNSLGPLVTILGPLTAALITGSFIVEYIYSLPGMGKHFVHAVSNRDYPLIMGATILYSFLVILANILVDIGYAKLDPRVKIT